MDVNLFFMSILFVNFFFKIKSSKNYHYSSQRNNISMTCMKQKQHTIKKEILTGQEVFGNKKHNRKNEKINQ